jgi:polycomb protein EED
MEIVAILPGHGKAVNDLKVHPVNDELMVSASYDKSIRLWNIRTCVCIAIFGGVKGHMSQAICVDIHPLGNFLMSGGMDSSLKIWNLQDPKIEEAISLSYTNPRKPGNVAFDTYTAQFPLFSTKEVHRGYIDCARWVGGFILSKSTENKLCLWTPDSNRSNQSASILREFPLPNSDQWFIKFDINIPLNIHAVGNTAGKVYIYTTLDNIANEKESENENSSIDNDNCVVVDDPNEDGAGVTGGAAYHKAVLSHPK